MSTAVTGLAFVRENFAWVCGLWKFAQVVLWMSEYEYEVLNEFCDALLRAVRRS